jgi:periplasmic protein CpxP/Spy
MKTWIKRTLIGTAAAVALLGGLAAWADRHHGHRDLAGWRALTAAEAAPLQGRVLERAARKLDLDAAQKDKLAALADRVRESRNALVSASANPRDELRAAMAGRTFDRDRVTALVQLQMAAAHKESPALITAAADFYDSLRPAQQVELRALLERGGRHGGHGCGGRDDD